MRFTDELRALTDDAHRTAERSPFITELLAGRRTAGEYAALLRQYEAIYAALEALVRASSDPLIAHFADPLLERSSAIEHDLLALRAAGIDVPDDVVPATSRFVAHLHGIAGEPVRLLAHHYLRYLGDLSGGQIIGRLAARHYDIPEDALHMWDFAGIDKPKRYKDAYRARLDEHIVTPRERGQFIQEAIYGYDINGAVFADLEATPATT